MSEVEFDDYVVLVNDEEEYSLWPTGREIPAGWKTDGTRGQKQECLSHIAKVWTDMRPKSLREALKGASR